jgi:hypothetical protein
MSGTTLNIRGNLMIEGKSEMSGVLKCRRVERPDNTNGKMTGEKFLGRNVYYREVELPKLDCAESPPHGLRTGVIVGFFPSYTCCIVAYGGDHFTTSSQVARVPIPSENYVSFLFIPQNSYNLEIEAKHDVTIFGLRLWVKYTDEDENDEVEETTSSDTGNEGSSGSSSSSGSGSGAGSEVIGVETPYP